MVRRYVRKKSGLRTDGWRSTSMHRCQLVAGRQEGTRGVETLTWGAVSSCNPIRLSPQKDFKWQDGCGHFVMSFRSLQIQVRYAEEDQRPRILMMWSGIPCQKAVEAALMWKECPRNAQGIFQIWIRFGKCDSETRSVWPFYPSLKLTESCAEA